MSKFASKRKQEDAEEEALKATRCPLCRLPFEGDFKGGKNEPVVPITRELMAEIMDRYGGCGFQHVDSKTGKFVAPVLKKGEVYAKHPVTEACVQIWCRVEGPHQCERSGLLLTPCILSLDPHKGCECDSLHHTQKQVLLNCKRQAMEEKEMQAEKQKQAAGKQSDEQSDQPARTLFFNNAFDSIPDA